MEMTSEYVEAFCPPGNTNYVEVWNTPTASGVLSTYRSQAETLAGAWVEELMNAVVRNPSTTGPTVASRAYGILGTAMYDAWSAYEKTPISTTLGDRLQRPERENTLKNKKRRSVLPPIESFQNFFPPRLIEMRLMV